MELYPELKFHFVPPRRDCDKVNEMMPAAPPRSAEYYRQRAADMRKEAMRAMSDELRQLYSQAAKSWEALADMADRPEKKKAAR